MRFRFRPSHATVVAYVALFVALGGTAAASVIITDNSQVAPGTISGHKPPSVDHANIIAGSINGTDIANRSGVDTCQTPKVAKFGPICAGSDGNQRTWAAAMDYCASSGLRMPSLSEAITLAKKFDVPGIGATGAFWTNDSSLDPQTLNEYAYVVDENGSYAIATKNLTDYTVCVTDPSA